MMMKLPPTHLFTNLQLVVSVIEEGGVVAGEVEAGEPELQDGHGHGGGAGREVLQLRPPGENWEVVEAAGLTAAPVDINTARASYKIWVQSCQSVPFFEIKE